MTGFMTRTWVASLLALSMTACSAEPAGDPDAPPAVLQSELRDVVLTPDTTLVSGLVPQSTTLSCIAKSSFANWVTRSSSFRQRAQVLSLCHVCE